MQNVQNVSFYVLSENKAQDLLGFICQLTQTALNKGAQPLLILTTDDTLLDALDEALWTFEPASFIPHQRLESSETSTTNNAPVLLGSYLPDAFTGMVVNTTLHPVHDFVAAHAQVTLTRVLEIIKPDEVSVQAGRTKYKHYKQLGFELTHFKV